MIDRLKQLTILLMGATVVLILPIHNVKGQCGSLGEPIVNIDFGTDVPDLGGGVTTYRYVNGGPSDGQYTLSKNANFNNGWHNMPDCSGDGFMLVVNADDNTAGEFYRIPVEGLCENTDFYFSAFIANVNTPQQCPGELILPNVKFMILDQEGNKIDSVDTGNIPASSSPEWLEYGISFNTGNNTEFQLVLINNNRGGCGNDLAIDDIQFRPCGPEIALDMDLALKQTDTLFFCEGDIVSIIISSKIISEGEYTSNPVFQWQTRPNDQAEWDDIPDENDEELTFMPVHDQWYRLSAAATTDNLSVRLCRIVSDSIRIARIVPYTDIPGVEVEGPICENEALPLSPSEFIGEGVGPLTYQWQLDNGNGMVDIDGAHSVSYVFYPNSPGALTLRRQAINVCGDRFATDTYEVEIMETIQTSFIPSQTTICMDDEPMQLAGGHIINGNGSTEGIYSGKGVANGYFDPSIAGVGAHSITFSPPAGTLCPEPSQAIITVFDTIYLDPMVDVVMLPGQTVTLSPQTNATQFNWSGQSGLDNSNTQYPVASPSETTTYTLMASNDAGCEKTGEITVTVLQDLNISNAFTPNGDGVNDVWEIDGLDEYPNAVVEVFNRWGNLVFSSSGYNTPWDGNANGSSLPAATYYYQISADLLDRPLSGAVTILR